MASVYVLKSLRNGKRYVGLTAEGVAKRLYEHNTGKNRWTRSNGPFQLVRVERYEDLVLARRRERFLKSGDGRAFLDIVIPR